MHTSVHVNVRLVFHNTINSNSVVFTNTSIHTTQAGQTINVSNLQSYKYATVVISYADGDVYHNSYEIPISDTGKSHTLMAYDIDSAKVYTGARAITINSASITIGGGYLLENGAYSGASDAFGQIRKITLHN